MNIGSVYLRGIGIFYLCAIFSCGTGGNGGRDSFTDIIDNDVNFDGLEENDGLAQDTLDNFEENTSIVCNGNCHFVREGATGRGDGSDWENAWTSLPDRLQRGHVYFIAGGMYPGKEFDDPEDGTKTITIIKATSANHECTSTAGWKDEYGSIPAVMPFIGFTTGFYIFDGVTGSGKEGYGFEIYDDSPADANINLIIFNQNVTDISIMGTEIHRPSREHKGIGVYATLGGNKNILFSRCYVHDMFGVHFYLVDAENVVIENSVMEANQPSSEFFMESIQAGNLKGLVVRNSWFEEIFGTGVIVNESGSSSEWKIYGNVFRGCNCSRGLITDTSGSSISNCLIYNNTFVDNQTLSGLRFNGNAGGNYARNNIFYNSSMIVIEGIDYNYNYYSNSTFPYEFTPADNEPPKDESLTHSSITIDPFINSSTYDYHLVGPLEGYPGIVLSPPFDVDPDGKVRGSDGVWDRGAYEYSI